MEVLKNKIIGITTKLQLSGFATITEEGKPWVRYVMTVGATDMSIRFATFVGARKVKHIGTNPTVNLFFHDSLSKAASFKICWSNASS